MKKLISVLIGFALYFIAMFMLTGYGNLKNHPSITDEVVSKFNAWYSLDKNLLPKFQNYKFDFFNYSITSEDFAASVMFYSKLSTVQNNRTIGDWISRGSLTADVPEVQASVRHFYDPTVKWEERYLQDVAFGPIMTLAQEVYPNPALNDVEWALEGDALLMEPNDPQNHKYCWNNGKKWFAEAMAANTTKEKDSLMGMAWRALGETLHMIEDHGCPAHVRDDSHPAPRGYGSLLGDPDTYEEYMADIFSSDISDFASSGKVDGNLKSEICSLKTVKEIAHSMAVWTNKNFFTNQTISGINAYGDYVGQIAHPKKEYTSPKLIIDMYSKATKYFTGKVAGYEVKMCKNMFSLYEFLWQGKTPGYPILDKECVKSQAEVLIPNIVETGVQVMSLFIPKVNVNITSCKENDIAGWLGSEKEPEYPNSLTFNGQVKIINKSKGNVFEYLPVKEGKFSGTVSKIKIDAGDKISAAFEVGGITISTLKDFIAEKKDNTAGTASLGALQFVADSVYVEGDYKMYTVTSTGSWDGTMNIQQKWSDGKVWGRLKITWNQPPSGSYLVVDKAVFWRLSLNFEFETIESGAYVYTPNIIVKGLSEDQSAHGTYEDWHPSAMEPIFCLRLDRDDLQVTAGKVSKKTFTKSYDILVDANCGGSPDNKHDGEIILPIYVNNYFSSNIAFSIHYYYPRD